MGIDPLSANSLRKAVFLDRDGVLNRTVQRDGKPSPPLSLADLDVPAETLPALQRLAAAGFLLVVATNQPDVARGKQTQANVEALHAHLRASLPLDLIQVCYHDDADACACRKPLPGMLLEAAREMGIDLTQSYMVGDRWRDVEAGQRAGCATLYIDYGYPDRQPEQPGAIVRSLSEAAEIILSGRLLPGPLTCSPPNS